MCLINFFFFFLLIIFLFPTIESSTRICDHGNCVFDCRDGSCLGDILICGSKADNCLVNCDSYQACGSRRPVQIYSFARSETQILCRSKDACIGTKISCGVPKPTATNLLLNFHSDLNLDKLLPKKSLTHGKCSLACGDVGCKKASIECNGDWTQGCSVTTTDSNLRRMGADQFKEGTFSCDLAKVNQTCSLTCNNFEACDKSKYFCYGGKCNCKGKFCSKNGRPIIRTRKPTTLRPTFSPTGPTNKPTQKPTTSLYISTLKNIIKTQKISTAISIPEGTNQTVIFNKEINQENNKKSVISKLFEDKYTRYLVFSIFFGVCIIICVVVYVSKVYLKNKYFENQSSEKIDDDSIEKSSSFIKISEPSKAQEKIDIEEATPGTVRSEPNSEKYASLSNLGSEDTSNLLDIELMNDTTLSSQDNLKHSYNKKRKRKNSFKSFKSEKQSLLSPYNKSYDKPNNDKFGKVLNKKRKISNLKIEIYGSTEHNTNIKNARYNFSEQKESGVDNTDLENDEDLAKSSSSSTSARIDSNVDYSDTSGSQNECENNQNSQKNVKTENDQNLGESAQNKEHISDIQETKKQTDSVQTENHKPQSETHL